MTSTAKCAPQWRAQPEPLSVASGLLAAADWWMNMLVSPGKQMELALLYLDYAGQVARYDVECFLAGTGEARRFIEPPARPPIRGRRLVALTVQRAISAARCSPLNAAQAPTTGLAARVASPPKATAELQP